MKVLWLIDVLCAVFFLVGLRLSFQGAGRKSLADQRSQLLADGSPEIDSPSAEMPSVFRMFGIMIMAFSFISCVFANLIARYSSNLPS